MTLQIEKIDAFFLEIENRIRLQDEIQNRSDIEQKFKEGKEIIDKIEEDDMEQHGYYRYNYHIKYATYLKTINEVERSSKHKNLAKKFDYYVKNLKNEDVCKSRSNSITVINEIFNTDEKYTQDVEKEEIEKRLKEIEEILTKKDDIIETFREIFNYLHEIPKTFKNYKTIIRCITLLNQTIENIIDMELTNKSLNANVKEKLITSLTCLNTLANYIAYDRRISFIRYILNSSDKTKIIFSNIPFTSGEINKHFKELALYFHPDKMGVYDAPILLRGEHKNLGEELFKHILKSKRHLLTDLENVIHEDEAYEFWKIAIDYCNAAKGKWDKLEILNQKKINGYTSEELKCFSVTNGKLAFEKYREACKLADATDIKKQIKLRKYMALCLYITGQSLESQLYALSAIRILLLKCPMPTSQDYMEIKKLLDKVKDNKHVTSETSGNITLDLVKLGQINTFYNKICYQHSINKDIEKIISELMLKPDHNFIRCKSSIFIESTLYYIIGIIAPIVPDIIEIWNAMTRNKLIEIINYALGAYVKGEYQEFINILSEEYKAGDSILRLKKPEDVVVPTNIIKIFFAKNIFQGVLNEDLVKDAEKLDNCIHELRKKNISYFSRNFYYPLSWKIYDNLLIKDVYDARKMPFVSRLEEIRNIARINIVTLDILTPEILSDFFWVIDGKETFEEMDEEFFEESIDSSLFESIDLNEQLKQASSQSERINIYNNIATYFEHLAEKDYKINRLNSLRNLNSAQSNYENAREIDPKNISSALGYTECLLKLSKYTQIIELNKASPFLTLSSEYWRFCSIAYCKQINYDKANECIIEALRLDPKNKLADKQISFLKKLRNENSSKHRIN
ncbi:10674_t:CDS:2 [Gigaspora margarita]|uniref:10674_t:CDS:1 n=1 Tax=Gigaspora margarita TaxID=4874 RepID=A0ABN7W1X8_GIGMA|nr:10674_t:CDS:2 [Gigaspora margarita]